MPKLRTMEEIEAALRDVPTAVSPRYITSAVNSPIDLYSGRMALRPDNGGTSVNGRLFLRWLPRPQVAFELIDKGLVPNLSEDWLRIDDLGSSCRVTTLSTSIPAGRFSGRLCDDPPLPGDKVDRVTFHLVNFHPYLGDAIRHNGLGLSRGRLLLRHRQWRVILDQVPGDDSLRKALKAEGGFAITNVGCIERTDGRNFSKAKARDLIAALHYFFSFCRGIWCGPTLSAGELSGSSNWLQWMPPHLASWCYRSSWWPCLVWNQGINVSRAFSGFMTLWNQNMWRDPLANCIHWYVEANSNAGGIEGGIILTQTALELLSWLVLVEDPKTSRFTEKEFNKWRAEVRIRHMLSSLRIPAGVPQSELPDLTAALPRLESEDGIGALVSIRNAVVHPRLTKRRSISGVSGDARIDALSLGLWFLEMSLLRLIRYRGVYYSRLKSGTNEEVREVMPGSDHCT